MIKYDFIKNYQRDLGALTSFIPSILYLIFMVLGREITVYNLAWLILTFTPLIIASGYLDIILKLKVLDILRYWWLKIITVWAIIFPPIRISSMCSMAYIFGNYIQLDLFLVLFSVLAGVMYGFFFIIFYIYLLRIFRRIR